MLVLQSLPREIQLGVHDFTGIYGILQNEPNSGEIANLCEAILRKIQEKNQSDMIISIMNINNLTNKKDLGASIRKAGLSEYSKGRKTPRTMTSQPNFDPEKSSKLAPPLSTFGEAVNQMSAKK